MVAKCVENSNILPILIRYILRKPQKTIYALFRLLPFVAVLSAFSNNTPIVAIFIPVIESWSIKSELPVTKLLIPLSYAAIIGGTCTIIGTSTNLVVLGLSGENYNFFEIGIIGWPLTVAGIAYMFLFFK